MVGRGLGRLVVRLVVVVVVVAGVVGAGRTYEVSVSMKLASLLSWYVLTADILRFLSSVQQFNKTD